MRDATAIAGPSPSTATGSVDVAGRRWSRDGTTVPSRWRIAQEVPVGILANSEAVAVMMATPADLEEMAVGYLLGEGMTTADAIRAALVLPTPTGYCVDVAVDPASLCARPARSLEGRSGCGLCGMTALTDVRLALPHQQRMHIHPSAVMRALEGLDLHQPLHDDNRSVHAAAFADRTGAISCSREDVGRHTALDKLIGALALRRIDPGSGFAVMTSRCSFELVQKAATAGLAGIATLSAPTDLALRSAQDAGLAVMCRSGDGVMVF